MMIDPKARQLLDVRSSFVLQVKEYILIGEADGGICGHPVLTWRDTGSCRKPNQEAEAVKTGGSRFDQAGQHITEAIERSEQQQAVPGKSSGFVRVDLLGLSRHQLCCTDERWLVATNSRTVSFRRSL